MRTKTPAAIVACFTFDRYRITREYRGSMKKRAMVLAAIEAMAESDPIWQPRRHNSDLAAKAAARELVHIPHPLDSSRLNCCNAWHRHCGDAGVIYDRPNSRFLAAGFRERDRRNRS
jgi:hypothetical protein